MASQQAYLHPLVFDALHIFGLAAFKKGPQMHYYCLEGYILEIPTISTFRVMLYKKIH